ncbi:hypothetical protein OF83DRAFT_1168717 [Amylostereum chailletii]|nr:hypothetical protein OF83DRAFT_1168717 [Amylostereum chailletii]
MPRRSFSPPLAHIRHAHAIRDDASKSHSTTTIIIAVVASLGALVLFFALWRLVRGCRRRSAPLPPVQPLAHHREHQLAQFVEHKVATSESTARPETWLTPASSSNLALLPPTPARQLSLSTQESASSEHDHPLSLYGEPLQPPNPSFFPDARPVSGSSSTLSSSAGASSDPSSPSTQSPNSASSRTRRVSTLSASTSRTSNTTHTSRSRSTYRAFPRPAAPHAPHSNIQIVLPTPLAPDLYPHMVGGENPHSRSVSVGGVEDPRRTSWAGGSLADGWTGVTAGIPRSSSRPDITVAYTRREPRRVRSVDTTLARPNNDSMSNLSHSSSMSPSTSREGSFIIQGDSPPVPRIPSVYGVHGPQFLEATPTSATPPSSYRGRAPRKLVKQGSSSSIRSQNLRP